MVKKAAQAKPNHLLRAARKERGWTQKEVADRIGAPLSLNVTRWERGTAFPSAHYVEQLCQLFGKRPQELGLLQPEDELHQEPAPSPALLWNVPYRRNPFFTGREEILTRLHYHLSARHVAALTRSCALCGLAGMGKTQIAVEYAYRMRETYQAVFWVRAVSRDMLIADYIALAQLIGLPGYDAQDQNVIVAALKTWLAQHEGWLLVLDNADNLSLVAEFLPEGGTGHLLLTTRSQAIGKIAPGIALEKMEPEDGGLLLLYRARRLTPGASLAAISAGERSTALAIVQALDGLPLALDQAGAYIEETGCSLAEYLDLCQLRRVDLLHRQNGASPTPIHAIANTWSLSFQQVEQANPAAADLLRLCAFLGAEAISETFLTEGASALGPVLAPVAADPFKLNEAMQTLRSYSLVHRDAEARTIQAHRLVEMALKEAMDAGTRRIWAERAVRTVNAAFPEVTFANWWLCQPCIPHARACAELIEEYEFAFPEAGRLLNQAGFYLRERGQYAEAEPLLKRALAIREQVLGAEHLDTALNMAALGYLYTLQGKYEQAVPLLARALSISEQLFGSEHPQAAMFMDDLATTYALQGQHKQAEQLYQRALSIKEHLLGPEHPHTGISLNNLAWIYTLLGQDLDAEPFYKRALTIYEKAYGFEHPTTALILDNLASLYCRLGQYAQAEPLHQRALNIYEQILGPEHPETAIMLNNLGMLYFYLDRYDLAEPLYKRALTIYENAMGTEALHPMIATLLNNLATLYHNPGKYDKALAFYQRALAIREQLLGAEHPDTILILHNMAWLYQNQGRYGQAEPLYRRVVAIYEKVLGPEHPRLADTLHNLAFLYEARSQYEEARPLYQRALAIREQALGPEHPYTVVVRTHYTGLLKKMQQGTVAGGSHGSERSD